MASPFGTLGNIDTLTVGNRVFTDLTNLLILGGRMNSGGSNHCTYRLGNGTAGYAAVNTLTAHAITIFPRAGGVTTETMILLKTDNDVGQATGTAFTTPVYHHGSSGSSSVGFSGPALIPPMNAIKFQVATTKFLSGESANNVDIMTYVYAYDA